mgnify:FL=1
MSDEEKERVALDGISRLRSFFRYTLNLPVTLPALGIENPDFDTLVKRLHENKGQTFGSYYKLTPDVTREIYHIAMG